MPYYRLVFSGSKIGGLPTRLLATRFTHYMHIVHVFSPLRCSGFYIQCWFCTFNSLFLVAPWRSRPIFGLIWLFCILVAGFENSLAPAAGTDGVRVTVQQPDTIANPSLEGFDIPSGISATIGLVASEIKRLPAPYGNCSNTNMELELLMQAIRRDLPGAPMRGHEVAKNSYRIADCRATCLQR